MERARPIRVEHLPELLGERPASGPESIPVAFAVMIVFVPAVRGGPAGVMLVNVKVPLPVDGAVAAAGCANSAIAAMAASVAVARGRRDLDLLICIPPRPRPVNGRNGTAWRP